MFLIVEVVLAIQSFSKNVSSKALFRQLLIEEVDHPTQDGLTDGLTVAVRVGGESLVEPIHLVLMIGSGWGWL